MPTFKHQVNEVFGNGGHPEMVRVPRHQLFTLVDAIIKLLAEHPYDPGLNEIRQALDPVECAIFPELKDRP